MAALRAAWWIPVGLLLLGAAGGVGGSKFLMTPTYISGSQLFVAASQTQTTPDVLQNNQLAQQRVPSYTLLVTSPEMGRELVSTLGLKQTPEQVLREVTASAAPNTVVINVTAT